MISIGPTELRRRLEKGEDVRVVDTRSLEDHEADGIEGSQNLPIREALLSGDVDDAVEQLDTLPKDTELVTVCDAGHASGETARLLRERGYDAKVLEGGLQAWQTEADE